MREMEACGLVGKSEEGKREMRVVGCWRRVMVWAAVVGLWHVTVVEGEE